MLPTYEPPGSAILCFRCGESRIYFFLPEAAHPRCGPDLTGDPARIATTPGFRCGCGHGAPLHAAITRDTALTARVRRGPAWCPGKPHPSTQPVAISPNWAIGHATKRFPPGPAALRQRSRPP